MFKIAIRPLAVTEYPLLSKFLYLAVFVPPGVQPLSREVVHLPELKIYIQDFGRQKGDCALAAEEKGQIAGICWCREIKDFAHWQAGVPSLAISVQKPYRGRGIGGRLLAAMKEALKSSGYRAVSLSVQKNNPAVRLYQRAGFKIVQERQEDYIMLLSL